MLDRSFRLVSTQAALARAFLNVLRVFDGELARFLIDMLAVRKLLLDWIPARFAELRARDS